MNTRFVFFIMLGLLSLITVQKLKSDVPPNMTEIELRGTLDYNPGPNSVEAYYNSNMVVVCFHQNFGFVNIVLIGEGATIYNQTINTVVQQTVYIPIAGSPSGRYTLIINDANSFAEGDFEK